MDNRPIGLLDSGLGGLSVAKKVIEKLPNESTVFIGDNAHMPYGDRTKEEIIELVRKSVQFLLDKNVKLIIFACNTATAMAMLSLKHCPREFMWCTRPRVRVGQNGWRTSRLRWTVSERRIQWPCSALRRAFM